MTGNSVNIPISIVILGTIVTIVLFIALVGAIFYLSRRVRILSKMRYGFGGKPLFSILIVLGIAVAVPLTLYASYQSVNIINYARAEKDVLIEIGKSKAYDDIYSVSFMAFPTVDNEVWAGKTYTMMWEISGDVQVKKIEKGRSAENPSYFVKELPAGEYSVVLLVESDDFRVRKEVDLSLI